MPPTVVFYIDIDLFVFFLCPRVTHLHRLLYLSGESNASGSPLLSRLDKANPVAAAEFLMNIGLVNDFRRLDEPPPQVRTLHSESGRKLRRRENGDFIPLY